MLDDINNPSLVDSALYLMGGGALVAWIKERRKGRKDAYTFSIEMINNLSTRVDGLVIEVAGLKAELQVAAGAVSILKAENTELKAENARLRTALGEQGRRADSAQRSLDWHEGQEATS